MRHRPALPPPAAPPTPEQLARRTVGARTADTPSRPITIIAYEEAWPARFTRETDRIRAALGDRVLALDHVGSTAVPGLPAKNRVDIDLIVADPADEDAYVPALTTAGYLLRTREPHWYEHRCLWTADHDVNLHVFGPGCDEHLRHLIFRDWLRAHPADRDLYAAHKVEAAALHPHSASAYVHHKGAAVRDILRRAGLR
ncbi:GrpB family protein [Actinoplanes sp. NPDC049802]|uniref:GrpB family protein n=1 Tax=Actinoplanes sp. NPDC049802 TaxID=3154742 RepID=UPI0033FB65D6